MRKHHIAFLVGMLVFLLTTMLAVMIPMALRHEMDTTGKITFVLIICLGYYVSGLLLYVYSQKA